MTLYPNPTTGMVYWRGVPEGEPVSVRAVDALGRLRFSLPSGESRGGADLSALPDGLHFVLLTGREGQVFGSKAVVLAKK